VTFFSCLSQIGTAHNVYIFDLKALSTYPNSAFARKDLTLAVAAKAAIKELFSNPDIVKAGWEFHHADFDVLKSTAQGLFLKGGLFNI
jgi:hypothetical protein